jgi:hypothetical protein
MVIPFEGPLCRHRFRWENKIKMDLSEIGLGDMDGTHEAGLEYVG